MKKWRLPEELELDGADYEIDDGDVTKFKSFVLPFSTVLRPFANEELTIYTEGVFGYTSAKSSTNDFFQGELPGLETSLSTRWETYGLYGGIGPRYAITKELTISGILSLGVSQLNSGRPFRLALVQHL